MDETHAFGFDLEGDVLTVNEAYQLHHMKRAAHVKGSREQAWAIALEKNFIESLRVAKDQPPIPCTVRAQPYSNHKPRQDVAACYPTVKAAIDGLVDAGVFPDDTGWWVQAITLMPEIHRPEMPSRGVRIDVFAVTGYSQPW